MMRRWATRARPFDREGFGGHAYVGEDAVESQQRKVGVDVDRGADGVHDQVEGAG
jgi:hypothetical protein